MFATEELAARMVRWWCREADDDVSSYFTADFVYDDGIEPVNREEFLFIRKSFGAIKDVKIVHIVASLTGVAVMFEGTDTVTELRHRNCWLMSVDEKVVSRIWSCSGTIPKPEDLPFQVGP